MLAKARNPKTFAIKHLEGLCNQSKSYLDGGDRVSSVSLLPFQFYTRIMVGFVSSHLLQFLESGGRKGFPSLHRFIGSI